MAEHIQHNMAPAAAAAAAAEASYTSLYND